MMCKVQLCHRSVLRVYSKDRDEVSQEALPIGQNGIMIAELSIRNTAFSIQCALFP